MGGRGPHAGGDNAQIKINTYLQRQEIERIQNTWEEYRVNARGISGEISTGGVEGGASGQILKKKCSCCLQYTLPAYSKYEMCPICGWIDDPRQNKDITLMQGKNPFSLKEARQRWETQKGGL